ADAEGKQHGRGQIERPRPDAATQASDACHREKADACEDAEKRKPVLEEKRHVDFPPARRGPPARLLKINPLYPIIRTIRHVHAAAAIDREGPWAAKPSRPSARATPGAERFALERELLHATVAKFHDVQIWRAARGNRDIVGIRKLAFFSAGSTEC